MTLMKRDKFHYSFILLPHPFAGSANHAIFRLYVHIFSTTTVYIDIAAVSYLRFRAVRHRVLRLYTYASTSAATPVFPRTLSRGI